MSIFEVFVSIGISSTVVALIYIGRKLQILDDLKVASDKTKLNIKVIGDHLTKSDTQFNPSELKAYSPLQLTPEGEKLISDIGFDKVFQGNHRDFCGYIDDEEPKLKYDVELAAIKSISALADKDYMQFLKVYFYNNPNRNMQNVAPTLGVYIRDKYLAKHPEITE